MLLGIYRPELPDDLSALLRYEARGTHRAGIVHWYALWGGWKSAFRDADLAAIARFGAVPMITWEPWADGESWNDPQWSLRNAILSGRHDAYIASWARGLAAYGQPVLLRFAHEMHHQRYPWAIGLHDNTPVDYVAAWRYVHDFFVRAGATNVQWVWNPNTLGDASAATYEPLYRALYPGDAYVDWLGLDVYNTGPDLDWGAPHWRTFRQVLSAPYLAITAVSSRPVILPEVGCTELGGSKAAWIREALTGQLQADFPRIQALVWFDVIKEQPWALDSSPGALAAWVLGSRALAAGTP